MPLPTPTTDETETAFVARCMGDETMKTDFTDDEQRLAVCFSQFNKTKEASMPALSDVNKRNLLQSALFEEYGLKVETPKPGSVVVEQVFENQVIYNIDGQLYQADYELGENGGAPTFTDPKKVLSTTVFRSMEAMTYENRRSLLDAALQASLNLGQNEYAWIEDMTETEFYYNHNHQSFKASYTIAEDNMVTIGDSVKVARQTTYKVMESLQAVYSDIIQEAGKRNAAMDSKRVKEILKLCEELLSSEAEPDEKKAKEAIKEATAVLKEVKAMEASKTEEGVKYPAGAYAYVPEVDNSETWKLRMWEDADKKVTKSQLGKAAAALSPGGLAGEKAKIPAESLAGVKRTLRAAYRKLGVEDADMPKWVQESMTRELFASYVPLTEAKIDKGRATVIVIKPGFNADKSRYYPAEMLKRDFHVFEGMKMYADHPTEAEDESLPERSIKSSGWVASLKDVTCDENGVVTGVADIIEDWLMKKLANLRDKSMLSEMGVSINAAGRASKSTIDGVETLVIEQLTACRSVDFVTEPGAGGAVTLYESERSRDIDLVELSGLKERRPDLVKAIEAEVRAVTLKEAKKAMNDAERITELEGQNATLTTERDTLQATVTETEKVRALAEAQATIKEAVDKAELPDAAKENLLKRFAESDNADGIDAAIQAEKDYLAKLSESIKIKGLGNTDQIDTVEKDKAAMRESYKRTYPDWTDAQLDTAVNGR